MKNIPICKIFLHISYEIKNYNSKFSYLLNEQGSSDSIYVVAYAVAIDTFMRKPLQRHNPDGLR